MRRRGDLCLSHNKPLPNFRCFYRNYRTLPELEKLKLVQDTALPKGVSFSRNGEVIIFVDIPDDIVENAVVPYGLQIELARFLEVQESRDQIHINLDLKSKGNFQIAIDYIIKQIINHPELSPVDKLKFLNSVMLGLEGLIQGNPSNKYVVKEIRANIFKEKLLDKIISELKKGGFILLPYNKSFEKLSIPQDKKVFFLHPDLFEWGVITLKEIGARIVPGIWLAGEKHLPLLIAPFKPEGLKNVLELNPSWHRLKEENRLPLIKTDRFIAIPEELGKKFLELAIKRTKEKLNTEEEREFLSLLQRINILTAEEVVTSYELTKPKENLTLAPPANFVEEKGKIDSDAIDGFLNRPPVIFQETTSNVPSDANQRYVVLENGDLIEIGTGRKIQENIIKIEPLKNGYYKIEKNIHKSLIDSYSTKMDVDIEIVYLDKEVKYTPILIINRAEGDLILSPDKRFACVQKNDGTIKDDVVFDLETRKTQSANFCLNARCC